MIFGDVTYTQTVNPTRSISMITTKITSSQEKIFADEKIVSYPELKRLTALKGERVSIQYMFTYEQGGSDMLPGVIRVEPKITGSLAPYVHSVRDIYQVPVVKTVRAEIDGNYLRTAPGLFPDVLNPLQYGGKISISPCALSAVWIEIRLPEDIWAGNYELKIEIDAEDYGKRENVFTLEVINAILPSEDIPLWHGFHADCLANYYRVPVWSDEHWRIVENFARVAVEYGTNIITLPIVTPPLDTEIGGERTTVQLIDITKNGDKYEFGFSNLKKWIDICDKVGVKGFAISPLFSQWGSEHAPKIMATVDGEYKRLFGWETDSESEEYISFVRLLLKAFVEYIKKSANDKTYIFQISDEPSEENLEKYLSVKNAVKDILKDYTVIDGIWDISFYERGIIETPLAATSHIKKFIDSKVQHLWAYYCMAQYINVSNRFHSMPAWRNRSIGMQLYKFNIEGFAHWGFNFYNNQLSVDSINPYLECGANLAFPGGDCFVVYPAHDGSALTSARLVVFYEALQDIKAMKLCEKFYGHDRVVKEIEDVLGDELTFERCALSSHEMLHVRERINQLIKAAL